MSKTNPRLANHECPTCGNKHGLDRSNGDSKEIEAFLAFLYLCNKQEVDMHNFVHRRREKGDSVIMRVGKLIVVSIYA